MPPTQPAILRVIPSRSITWPILLLGLACASIGSPDWIEDRAVIQDLPGEPFSLHLPATITAGVASGVTVRTVGLRYCTRLGRTDVTAAGMVITLEPYDSSYVGDLACPGLPGDFVHTVHITFPAPGAGILRVIGRSGGSSDIVTVDTVLDVQ